MLMPLSPKSLALWIALQGAWSFIAKVWWLGDSWLKINSSVWLLDITIGFAPLCFWSSFASNLAQPLPLPSITNGVVSVVLSASVRVGIGSPLWVLIFRISARVRSDTYWFLPDMRCRVGSWQSTSLLSLVTWISHSSASAPSCMPIFSAFSVFSGARPAPPLWAITNICYIIGYKIDKNGS